jgi:hypothetical protein
MRPNRLRIKIAVAVAAILATLISLTLIPATSANAAGINGCDLTATYLTVTNNGLAWSWSDGMGAWHGAMHRAGGCGHLYVQHDGWAPFDGPVCAQYRVRTYRWDGSNWVTLDTSAWFTYAGFGWMDLRPGTGEGRRYRVYGRACSEDWRGPDRWVGFREYAA